jgi:hypothetical protein
MAFLNFQPDVWSAQLLSALEKTLVYAGPQCVNRDYEGDIAHEGDTVHVTTIDDPNIATYTRHTDLTIQVMTDADRVLSVDQAKYYAFEIDDIDKRQARDLMAEAANRGALGLTDAADQHVAAKMALAAQNSLGVVDVTTPTNVYDNLIIPAGVKLSDRNVPHQGRWLVIDPVTHGQLRLDSRFIKVNEAGTDQALRNGVVGRAGGFTIMKSNNAFQANRAIPTIATANAAKTLTGAAGTFNQGDIGLTVTGTGVGASAKIASVNLDGSVATTDTNSTATGTVTITLAGGGRLAIAGSPVATSYAEQLNRAEPFRPQKRFADALKGLHLYGAKVFYSEALLVTSVKSA